MCSTFQSLYCQSLGTMYYIRCTLCRISYKYPCIFVTLPWSTDINYDVLLDTIRWTLNVQQIQMHCLRIPKHCLWIYYVGAVTVMVPSPKLASQLKIMYSSIIIHQIVSPIPGSKFMIHINFAEDHGTSMTYTCTCSFPRDQN